MGDQCEHASCYIFRLDVRRAVVLSVSRPLLHVHRRGDIVRFNEHEYDVLYREYGITEAERHKRIVAVTGRALSLCNFRREGGQYVAAPHCSFENRCWTYARAERRLVLCEPGGERPCRRTVC